MDHVWNIKFVVDVTLFFSFDLVGGYFLRRSEGKVIFYKQSSITFISFRHTFFNQNSLSLQNIFNTTKAPAAIKPHRFSYLYNKTGHIVLESTRSVLLVT